MDEPLAKARLPGYEIERLIARGGMGVVYLARDKRLNRKVALKLLPPTLTADSVFRRRFQRESEIAASLDHPNIVPIYEFGESDGILFISMRYVEGSDLRVVLEDEGELTLPRTSSIVRQIAGALDVAHEKGLVHRDIKPANVLLTTTGGLASVEHVYLTDFGLTKEVRTRSGLTGTGQFIGSIDYMAPEQIQSQEIDHKVDIYALGCLAYECLAGTVPFAKETDAGVLVAHLQEEPPALTMARPDLPVQLDAAIRKAMAKDPDDRFSTCGEFVRAAGMLSPSPRDAILGQVPRVPPRRLEGRADATSARERPVRKVGVEDASEPSRPWFRTRAAGIVGAAVLIGTGVVVWGLVRDGGSRLESALAKVASDPSTRIAVGSSDPRLGVFIASPEKRTQLAITKSEEADQVAVSRDLGAFAVAQAGSVTVRNLNDKGVIREIETQGLVVDLEFGPDGVLAAVLQRPGTGGTVSAIATVQPGDERWVESKTIPGFASSLDWSPDSKSIAFSVTRGAEQSLLVFDLATGRTQSIDVGIPGDDPAWSPDGRYLAFAGSAKGSFDIYIANLEPADAQESGVGVSRVQVTRITNDIADETDPTWSPDGRFIAFMRADESTRSVYIADVQGKRSVRLSQADPRSCCLEWLPTER